MTGANPLLLLAAFAAGVLAGYVTHELAHYVVLWVAGRNPTLSLWPPKATFTTPAHVPLDVRVAAVAPALLGVLVAVTALAAATVSAVWFVFLVAACARLFALSPTDRQLAAGNPAT